MTTRTALNSTRFPRLKRMRFRVRGEIIRRLRARGANARSSGVQVLGHGLGLADDADFSSRRHLGKARLEGALDDLLPFARKARTHARRQPQDRQIARLTILRQSLIALIV